MASDNNARNRGWRGGQSAGGRPEGRSRAWKKEPSAGVGPRKMPRWAKRLIAAGVLGVVVGLVVLLFYILRPIRPARVELFGTPNETDIGHEANVYGWNDLHDLVKATGNTDSQSFFGRYFPGSLKLEHDPRRLTPEAWDQMKWSNVRENTIIVFLTVHGGADDQGPFLFLEDAHGRPPLRLEEVLNRLNDDSLKDKKKLLVLDATRSSANWSEGMLHNDFVRALKEPGFQERIRAVPNLAVLCSSDTDQRSWVSEEWGQSVFGHYFIEGLKGAADKGNTGRVTVGSLTDYVTEQVKKWVLANRDAVQEPKLLGNNIRDVDVVKIDQKYAEPTLAATPDLDFAALESEWETCKNLRDRVPSPRVYAPHLWRRYQDTLLRYEQLLRAGDRTGAAAKLKEQLQHLRDDLTREERLAGRDAVLNVNSLPMPAVLGIEDWWHQNGQTGKPREKELAALFRDVWDAWTAADSADDNEKKVQQKKRDDTWAALQKWAEGVNIVEKRERSYDLLRLKLTELLLRQFITAPREVDLAKVHELLVEKIEKIEGRTDLRAVEAHLLAVLTRPGNLAAAPPPFATLQLAVRVRLQAERVALGTEPIDGKGKDITTSFYPYSEQIYPWIKELVEKADAERFDGENLLFASNEAGEWQLAEGKLKAAEKDYADAARRAATAREALRTRDEVFADLPYYSRWLANQRVTPDSRFHQPESDKLNGWLETAENCWQAAHELDQLLEDGPGANGLDKLDKKSAEASAFFKKIENIFEDRCNDLKKETPNNQERWQQIDDVLSVPVIGSPADRIALLKAARDISRKLAGGGTQSGTTIEPGSEAREQAQRQGRMAAAILGDRGLDGEANRKRLVSQIKDAPPREWWLSLRDAGRDIGKAWRGLAEQANGKWGESLRSNKAEPARASAIQAAALCRLLEGAAAAAVSSDPFSPVTGERRWRLHDMLLWQTERTLRDHWYSDTDNGEKYYIVAGGRYLADARSLAQTAESEQALNKERQAVANEMAKKLQPAGLKVPESSALPITTQSSVEQQWQLIADRDVPQGAVVVWPELKGPLALVNPKDQARRTIRWPLRIDPPYRVRPTGELSDPDELASLGNPEEQKAEVSLHVFYRGQHIDADRHVTIQRSPDTIVYRYQYRNADKQGPRISVRAGPGVNDNTLTIVLDASGSMGVAAGVEYTSKSKCKYHDATAQLRTVLGHLPPGTRVSIWVFGHKDAKNPANDFNIERFPSDPTDFLDPTKKSEIDRIMEKVEAREPHGYSPIARTMVKAMKQDREYRSGFRTLLVLTDGDDNDDTAGWKDNIPNQIDGNFNDSNIVVHMILFQVETKAERDNVEKQFSKVRTLNRRNRLEPAENPEQLAKRLERLQTPTVVLYQKGEPVRLFQGAKPAPEELKVTVIRDDDERNENLTWTDPLKVTGDFDLQIYNMTQKVSLKDGDNLLITLKRVDQKIVFERTLFAERESKFRVGERQVQKWLAAVMDNRFVSRTESLEMLYTLELEDLNRRRPKPSAKLQQDYPGFQWIEVRPTKGDISGLRWGNTSDYYAPAWRLEAPRWPKDPDSKDPVAAALEVWWTDSDTMPIHATVPSSELTQFPKTFSLRGGGSVTIDSARPERRKVRVATDPDKWEERDCLVVELSHPENQPVWVQLEDHAGGQEHLFFKRSNRATAIFWRDEAGIAKNYRLTVTSLKAFKEAAEAAGLHAQWDALRTSREGNKPLPVK